MGNISASGICVADRMQGCEYELLSSGSSATGSRLFSEGHVTKVAVGRDLEIQILGTDNVNLTS